MAKLLDGVHKRSSDVPWSAMLSKRTEGTKTKRYKSGDDEFASNEGCKG